MIHFLAEQAPQTCQPNQWVELLHDWGWGIAVLVFFAIICFARN